MFRDQSMPRTGAPRKAADFSLVRSARMRKLLVSLFWDPLLLWLQSISVGDPPDTARDSNLWFPFFGVLDKKDRQKGIFFEKSDSELDPFPFLGDSQPSIRIPPFTYLFRCLVLVSLSPTKRK